MAAKVKPKDLQQALDRNKKNPVYLVDADGNTTHVVLPVDDAQKLLDQWLRRELQIGFDEADRGEVVEWDPEKIKAEGHKRLQQKSQAS